MGRGQQRTPGSSRFRHLDEFLRRAALPDVEAVGGSRGAGLAAGAGGSPSACCPLESAAPKCRAAKKRVEGGDLAETGPFPRLCPPRSHLLTGDSCRGRALCSAENRGHPFQSPAQCMPRLVSFSADKKQTRWIRSTCLG